ncbi:hypothetical protein [Caldilinea sp.]|uniref:hypothetical protein n=1 Tax=Caldilinea sp. TaxID=2293560 RepID=UPI002B9AC590|nr:hypothetical protein [Anaerolineales bacterium]HQY92489.1 hypothetical protein [Caldilinea sp.]HRA64371.1 hypothetical protein [Caldilinea sp.]
MNAQEWIDRYVDAVGEALPVRERGDVEAEIRSLIQDELEARGADLESLDEQMVLSVLEQFGRPEALAARYHAPRALIGPALYPTFRIVTTVVLLVLTGVWIFGMAVDIGLERRTIGNPAGMLVDLIGGLFQTFGTLVFVFALIETLTRGKLAAETRQPAWEPRSLPKIEQSARVKVGELVVGIGFSLVAILVLNAYPQWISAIMIKDGQVTSLPLLSENFISFVPWLTLLWSLTIALNAYVLAQGRWRTLTRVLQMALSVFGLAILAWMLMSGPLLAWPALEPVAKLVVAIVFAVTGIDLLVQVYRLAMQQITGANTTGGTPSQAA